MKWAITRDSSKRWAVAKKTSSTDSIESLAMLLKLDTAESQKWLKQLDVDDCTYEVPNVFCVYTSKSGWGDGLITFATHLKRVAMSDAERYRKKGFRIISHQWANSEDVFCNMWTEDGIYALSFAGHGSYYGFVADISSDSAVGPDAVHPPYHLAAVRAYSCMSSREIPGNTILPNGSIPTYSWKNHVSSRGTFFGYSGKVNWVSQFWLEESINEEAE